MSKLKKERLNQMIDNALAYKQESRQIHTIFLYKKVRCFILKRNVYLPTLASLIIACVFIPPIVTSRNLVNMKEINDYVTLMIIDDF